MLTEYMESKGHNKQRAKILRDKMKMDDGVRHANYILYTHLYTEIGQSMGNALLQCLQATIMSTMHLWLTEFNQFYTFTEEHPFCFVIINIIVIFSLPLVVNSLPSGQFWVRSTASVHDSLSELRMFCTVFIQDIHGHHRGLFQSTEGHEVKNCLAASKLSSMQAKYPNEYVCSDWIISASIGRLVGWLVGLVSNSITGNEILLNGKNDDNK